MGKKKILLPLVLLVLVYPLYALFKAAGTIGADSLEFSVQQLVNFQISLWLSWVIFVTVAVFQKWNQNKNLFFYFTYGFILVGFAIFGYLHQQNNLAYNLPDPFADDHTLGVLSALKNLFPAAAFTAALQAAVWWFTRRWHRR